MTPKPASSVRPTTRPGVRNSLAILHVLSEEAPLTFGRLLVRCGDWPKATLVRCLKTLQEEGWVVKNSDGAYVPGAVFLAAAHRLGRRPPVGELVQSAVDWLAEISGQSAAFVAWAPGGGFTFLAKKEMPDSYHHLGVGQTNPALLTHAYGQLALAFQPQEVVRGMLRDRCQLAVADQDAWLERLARIRADGFVSFLDCGLRFAAAVVRDAECCGVIGLSMIPRELHERERQQYQKWVLAAAERAKASLVSVM